MSASIATAAKMRASASLDRAKARTGFASSTAAKASDILLEQEGTNETRPTFGGEL
ncbi:hypothetical protein NKH54_22675 [Mesorhizobium sp. M1004]|uniref:hypothetical protein n=1 Tax=Mesorhizobium sp. M1004 TaxID=2957046 RepID=UPI00333A51A0